MNASELIDQRIQEFTDWRGPIFAQLRKLVLETDPKITEEWKWNTAVWSHNGLVCAVSAFKDNVGINFFKGASLKDAHGLINAGLEAKATRMVKFYEGDKINVSALKDLIHEAVVYNTGQ